jgi:hypothetical protein
VRDEWIGRPCPGQRQSTWTVLCEQRHPPHSTSFMAVFSPIQLIASVPPLTRFFTLATFLLSLFYLYLQWKSDATYPLPYLTLVPGSSLFYPWTFFTSAFVETTIYEVCCHPHSQLNGSSDATFLAHLHAHRHPPLSPLPRAALGCCRDHKIHRSHGHFFQYYRIRHELDRVCLVSECRPFSVSRVALDEPVLTIYRYGMQYHGQMALQVGVLVAFTQLIPEHQVQVFGVFRARVKV